MTAPPTPSTIATLTASTGTTTLVLVVLLIALGGAMVLTAVWLVRTTRSDAPALAPLEAMGTRRWSRADPDRRSALVASARPEGAPDPAPTVPYGDQAEPTDEPELAPVGATEAEPEPAAPEPVAESEADAEAEVDEPVTAPESS